MADATEPDDSLGDSLVSAEEKISDGEDIAGGKTIGTVDNQKERLMEFTKKLNISAAGLSNLDMNELSVSIDDDVSMSGAGVNMFGDEFDALAGSDDSVSVALSLESSRSNGGFFVAPPTTNQASINFGPGHHGVGIGAGGAEDEVQQWKANVETLAHGHRLLEIQLAQQKEKYLRDVVSVQTTHRADLEAVREKQRSLEAEIPELRKRLALEKESVRDLLISDALALELQRTPETQLSVREFICLNVHKIVQTWREQLEASRKELQQTRDELSTTTEHAQETIRGAEHKCTLAEGRERSVRAQLAQAQASCEEMEARLRESTIQMEGILPRAAATDAATASAQQLRQEVEAGRATVEAQATALRAAQDALADAQRRTEHSSKALALVEVDKSYLEKDAQRMQAALRRVEKELSASVEECREAKRARERAHDLLLAAKEENRSAFEDRLALEVARLQERSKKEMDEIRINGREVWERENRVLREARQEAVENCERLEARLEALRRAHDQLVVSQQRSEAAHEASAAEQRAEAKMRQFELAQLKGGLEEKSAALAAARLENDMMKEKFEVLKSEFGQLEATAHQRQLELQLELSAECKKVTAYESLEAELDAAVLSAGQQLQLSQLDPTEAEAKADIPTEKGGGGQKQSSGNEVLNEAILSGIPTRGRRRVQHSIQLAQRVARVEAEAEAVRGEAAAARSALSDAEARAEEAERQLQCLKQPQQYLVDTITEKERLLTQLRAKLGRAGRELAAAEEARAEAVASARDSEQQLQRLLGQRAELSQLRAMLQDLQFAYEQQQQYISQQKSSEVKKRRDTDADQEERRQLHTMRKEVDVQPSTSPEEEKQDRAAAAVAFKLDSSLTLGLHDDDDKALREKLLAAPPPAMPKWYKKLR